MDELQRAANLFFRALERHRKGDLTAAEPLYREALLLAPQRVSVLVNLAAVLVGQRRFAEALRLCERALRLEPDTLDALHTAALCRLELYGDEEALALTERVLQREPDNFAALCNRGVALRDRGRFEEALASFERALALRPGVAGVRCNRAATLFALARTRDALAEYLAVLRAWPDQQAPQQGLFEVFCEAATVAPLLTPEIEALVLRAAREAWGRPQAMAPLLGAIVLRRAIVADWLARTDAPVAPLLAALRDDAALLTLLECGVVADARIERLLASLRAELLLRASLDGIPRKGGPDLALHCALAQQAFLAGYLDLPDADMRDRLAMLRQRLHDETSPAAAWIAACACYAPLDADPQTELLLARDWPEPVQRLLRQQLREPAEERRLATTLTSLGATPPPATTSSAQAYPRWVGVNPRAEPLSLITHVRLCVPGAAADGLRHGARVAALDARCGTGQEAIEIALRLRGVELLAIDPRRARLAYAKRMAQSLGAANLRFAIAELGGLSSALRFDLIEAGDTLQEAADPARTLAALAAHLSPGGVMRVALHSALGRRHLDAARDFVDAHGLRDDDDGVRAARRELLRQPEASPLRGVLRYEGFHRLHECRALLFGEREHRHDLPGLRTLLTAQGLDLLGLETPPATRAAFRREFPAPAAQHDLDTWHAFERRHPDSFIGGYRLWLRRPEG